MNGADVALLLGGGLVAGVVNTLAGGGSLLTVPLLVLLGVPGTEANATNRVGVLFQSLTGAWRFRSEGVSGLRDAVPLLLPLGIGSGVGAVVVSRLDDAVFEKIFGVLMVPLLIPAFFSPRPRTAERALPAPARAALFFGIGLYGGAIQAGVGLFLVAALARDGFDLVRANSVKMAVVAAFTLLAVAVFVWEGQVVWLPGLVLAAAASLGAVVGARLAVRGGERLIRPVLVVAVLALSGRMLGLY